MNGMPNSMKSPRRVVGNSSPSDVSNGADFPEKIQKVCMWQQAHHQPADSGIHSGARTTETSVSGWSQCTNPIRPHGGNAGEVVAVAAAQDFENHVVGQETSQTLLLDLDTHMSDMASPVANFRQPSCSSTPKTAVTQQQPVPEQQTFLLDFLTGSDLALVRQAVQLIKQASAAADSYARSIASSPVLVSAMLHVMVTCEYDEVLVRNIAETLHNLTHHPNGLNAVLEAGGVTVLIRMLGGALEAVRYFAVTSIHNLLLHTEHAKDLVRSCGGVETLVALLTHTNSKFVTIAVDCLHILAYQHPPTKMVILARNGPKILVELMRNSGDNAYEKLLWACARLLKVLSVCPHNKMAVVQVGGVCVLTRVAVWAATPRPSQRLLLNCLWTIRNLSDIPVLSQPEEPMEQVLESLARLVSQPERVQQAVVICVSGILANLTCNQPRLKAALVSAGCIQTMLACLCKFGDDADVADNLVTTLRHLTARHEEVETAQQALRHSDGLSLISRLIRHHATNTKLLKSVLVLTRNACQCAANQSQFGQLRLVPQLFSFLPRPPPPPPRDQAPNDAQQQTSQELLLSPERAAICQGVLGVLQHLAKQPDNCQEIIALGGVRLLSQLLAGCQQQEGLTQVVTALLSELVDTAAGAAAVTSATYQRLRSLMHSPHEAIASYAAVCMYRIDEQASANAAVVDMMKESEESPEADSTMTAMFPLDNRPDDIQLSSSAAIFEDGGAADAAESNIYPNIESFTFRENEDGASAQQDVVPCDVRRLQDCESFLKDIFPDLP